MISGTNGLLGAADGGFILRKEKRTSNSATLEVSGRDQPDQKIYLNRNPETLVWELEKIETELWKLPPEPLLENIAGKITNENPEWYGSPTELVEFLGVDMKANAGSAADAACRTLVLGQSQNACQPPSSADLRVVISAQKKRNIQPLRAIRMSTPMGQGIQ